jgi:hypothetical protein
MARHFHQALGDGAWLGLTPNEAHADTPHARGGPGRSLGAKVMAAFDQIRLRRQEWTFCLADALQTEAHSSMTFALGGQFGAPDARRSSLTRIVPFGFLMVWNIEKH